MTLEANILGAAASANYAMLADLDTGGVYTCLEPDCCSSYIDYELRKAWLVQALLNQYALTQTLPTDWDVCCDVICGTLESGTPVEGDPTFETVTADDLILGGAPSIAQIRRGTGTLAAGTATIAATWVTANTRIVATYTVASAAGQANISIGTITPGVSFVVNGEGTNTFHWIAVV